jgi:putative tricarboxylic transport membrane protein
MRFQISKTDEIAGGILVLFAGAVYVVSGNFPSGIGGAPGPAFFPRFVVIVLSILAMVQFISASMTAESSERIVNNRNLARFIIPAMFLIAYAVILPFVGFLLTTFAFLTAMMYYSGARDLKVILPIGAVASVILQNVFVGFLRVPLPEGPLELGRLVSFTSLI